MGIRCICLVSALPYTRYTLRDTIIPIVRGSNGDLHPIWQLVLQPTLRAFVVALRAFVADVQDTIYS